MIFNTSKRKDFEMKFKIDNTQLDIEEETKLLGVHFTSNLKWQKHIDETTRKAYKKIWIIKRLAQLGASEAILSDTYCKQVRSQLEYCVPVWHPSLTVDQSEQLERVQSASLRVILGDSYKSARSARDLCNFKKLDKRREELCLNFGLKSLKHPYHSRWFKPTKPSERPKRKNTPTLQTPFCRTKRYQQSTVPYISNLINKNLK